MILTETTRLALSAKLYLVLDRYNVDQLRRSLHPTKRPVYFNPSALRLYTEALERAMGSLQYEGVTVETALAENFSGHLLKTLLKAYARMKFVDITYSYEQQ